MKIDQLAFARDCLSISDHIAGTISSSRGGRKVASGASSSRTIVSFKEFKRLEAKVDKVDRKMEKLFVFVNDIGECMKEAWCTNNDDMPSTSAPPPLPSP